MNKQGLINEVAQKTGISKKDATVAVTATFDVIEEALGRKEDVSLVNFGTFSVKDRAQRTGINPQTKEPMIIPACQTPHFKAGKKLKETVKGL